MKKTLTAAALCITLAIPAFAAEVKEPSAAPAPAGKTAPPDFKQKKAQILKNLDERIAALQQDKKCIQAAKADEDLRACRDKGRAMREGRREEMKNRRNTMRNSGAERPAPGGK